MSVSFSDDEPATTGLTGASARTRDLMVRTAVELMQRGQSPSVSEAAEAAGVSRATAYRYFPTQSALVEAVVDHALGPILRWDSGSADAVERVQDLLSSSNERILEFEATFKAALGLSLQQWAQTQSGTPTTGPQFRRGHRIDLLEKALAPLREKLSGVQFDRLAKALSLTFGIEVILVLKDIWNVEIDEMQDVATWTARALVRAALAEAQTEKSAADRNQSG
jgi:AcrR family transcriptional regulator